MCVSVCGGELSSYIFLCLASTHFYSAPFASCVIAFVVVFFGSIQKCVIQVPGSCSSFFVTSLSTLFIYSFCSAHLLRAAGKMRASLRNARALREFRLHVFCFLRFFLSVLYKFFFLCRSHDTDTHTHMLAQRVFLQAKFT